MSDCWCHWSNLSAKKLSGKTHTKEMVRTICLLKKSLDDQILNKKLTSYEKR